MSAKVYSGGGGRGALESGLDQAEMEPIALAASVVAGQIGLIIRSTERPNLLPGDGLVSIMALG